MRKSIIIAILCLICCCSCGTTEPTYKEFTNKGVSMLPTIKANEVVEYDGNYEYELLERGDLVLVTDKNSESWNADSELYLKRVIAVGGDHLVIENGNVRLNGEVLSEEYILDGITDGNVDIRIPEREIYVLGDNRSMSTDSRHFGTCTIENYYGKVVVK